MKKIFSAFLLVLLAFSLFTACGNNGGPKYYTTSANRPSERAITAFSFPSVPATGTIDDAATVPYITDVTALVATFTTTGVRVRVGAIAQISGTTPNNFTSPVAYIVTAENGSSVIYTVTVTKEPAPKALTSFSIVSPAAIGSINETLKRAFVIVPQGTDRTSLIATFTSTGASVEVGSTIQVSGTTRNNFTNPVTYVVVGADDLTEPYTVTVISSVINLPRTGQDDGALQKGVPIPSSRFSGGCPLTDTLTGLMWTRYAYTAEWGTCTSGVKNWQTTLDYIACLNTAIYYSHPDWRMPNRKELRSLIDFSQASPQSYLNTLSPVRFINVANNYLTTSTTSWTKIMLTTSFNRNSETV